MIILWLYARLLRLYPRGFYERFGLEMLDVFQQARRDRPYGHTATLIFFLREFGGLLISIITEYGQSHSGSGLRMLFRKRFIPVWLFIFSVITAVSISLNYWGYLIRPPSTISAVKTIDHIALVRFDSNFRLSALPLNELPYTDIPDFPPSQILRELPANLRIDKTLDPTLAEQLSAALAHEQVEIGMSHLTDYLPRPAINANGCGQNCFLPGVQPQTDGSLLVIYPEMVLDTLSSEPGFTQHMTPNDAWYYTFVIPAGYVIQGRDADGVPLVFTAIASGAVENDHYRYNELIFTQSAGGLTLRNRQSYNFDIAGLEGFNVALITICLFVPLAFFWFVILFVGSLIAFVRRQAVQWRSFA
jgi:hypothetical protein